ncbi:MAG TPA: purine-nucleoside phosphorylase [Usitatibacteraceae bacterium]|nr:purine-nucleoside phosphorylase [Usitatibacteraceae bacterium]
MNQPTTGTPTVATPHINAQRGDFAETVLMPGDPLRAQFIAGKWLQDARQVNTVRNMWGYTGTFQGKRLSVMAHGMGIPSCSIYATELIREYGVKNLIRVGSCGALLPDIRLGDVILAMGASTDSKVNRVRLMDHDFAAIADFDLLRAAVDAAHARGEPVRVGNVFSADLFYTPQPELFDRLARLQILAVEMELAGLYAVAAEHGARALGMLTVSDLIKLDQHLSAEERQNSFGRMIEIALATAVRF